jgi:hypothetical protein
MFILNSAPRATQASFRTRPSPKGLENSEEKREAYLLPIPEPGQDWEACANLPL